MEKKTIKAVPMVRRIRDDQHEELREKTWEERVAFYKAQARTLHAELEKTEPAQENGEEAV